MIAEEVALPSISPELLLSERSLGSIVAEIAAQALQR